MAPALQGGGGMMLHSQPATAPGSGGSWWRCPPSKGPCRIGSKGVAGPRGTRVGGGWRAQAGNVSSAKAAGFQATFIENKTEIGKWPGKPHDLDEYHVTPEAYYGTGLQSLIDQVRAMLRSMNDGKISVSAYDTAWVALVPKLDGGEGPQFPAAVRWIVGNQLPDGSWGDSALFSAYDRMTNTLACVVALTKWSLEPEKCKTGLSFLHENMWRLEEEEQESMPIGFEIVFPSLIQTARSLGIDFPYDHPALHSIYTNREIKLKRIPKDMMHRVPTSILHSLEGMPDQLDWTKLLQLQSSNGSFLYSPSATAYALMQTGDKKCFNYIDGIVKKFDGGVPNVYPVDLFEHIWVVDRIERLGISRYFQREIKQCTDYVNRHWTEEGICWARNSNVKDVDDTAMAFRLLRLHGYNVSPSVFKNFEKDGEFFCFMGQSTQAVTGMYNLNRASQIGFHGEDILHRARIFSYEFLRQREARGMLQDKWIIAKDLAGEVKYTLDFPWYASLPRVEARTYLDQYGGNDDVWIGKTLYRMPLVNNDIYLELARRDFNRCQVLHQLECRGLQMWCNENGLGTFGVAPEDVLRAYFLAAACIFEPSRASERLAWARVSLLANTICTHFHNNSQDKKRLGRFVRCLYEEADASWLQRNPKDAVLARALHRLTDLLAQEAPTIHGGHNCIHNLLRRAWTQWMLQEINKEDGKYNESSVKELRHMVYDGQTCLLLVQVIEICAGRIGEAAFVINNKGNDRLVQLACSVCGNINYKALLSQDPENNEATINHIDKEIEWDMQELAQSLLLRSDEKTSNSMTKKTLWDVVRSSYYAAHCPPYMMDRHVTQVIFVPV